MNFIEIHNNFSLLKINIIGALVSKPNLYRGRNWEYLITDSVDITDSFQSNISIYTKGNELHKIQPRNNILYSDNWLADKSRYLVDAFNTDRIITPIYNIGTGFEYTNWNSIYNILTRIFEVMDSNVMSILGAYNSFQEITTMSNFNRTIGNNNIYYKNFLLNQNVKENNFNSFTKNDFRKNYLLNSSVYNLYNFDTYIFINNTLRYEIPILYSKLKGYASIHNIKWIVLSTFYSDMDSKNRLQRIYNNTRYISFIQGKHIFSRDILLFTKPCFFGNTDSYVAVYVEQIIKKLHNLISINLSESMTIYNIEHECGQLTSSEINIL